MFKTTFAWSLRSLYSQYLCGCRFFKDKPDPSYEYFYGWFPTICYVGCCNERFLRIYEYHLKELRMFYTGERYRIYKEFHIRILLDFLIDIAFNCVPVNRFDDIHEYSYWTFSKNDFYTRNVRKDGKGQLDYFP